MPGKEQVPVAPGLFTWLAEDPRLIGSRCAECGVMAFPAQSDCPGCAGAAMEESLFDRRGTLWTFTTQEFIPKSPPYAKVETAETFRPYAVGYVEFPGQAKVEGRIDETDFSKLKIGMEMEVVVVPFMESDGADVMTYAFRPVR
jgi:uncharacterized OB-fold protein